MNQFSLLLRVIFFAGLLLVTTAPAIAAPEEKADEESKEWEVAAPGLPTHETTIKTETGTWMSLDLSPDGKHIVFDMLGDIFIMPATGGDAKALTQGLPWDMQPRFSPDGQRIVFTSDRGGGDNIWTMDLNGENSRQVSDESFRLLNSPNWSPDGRFIVARKHFTKHRSLGTGEIWMYHFNGGKGVQLTKKTNDQKDLGEPIFSADGRFVYYSLDATPGAFFEYNKDPNPGIYEIQRLNLEDGEIETVISGPGGAIRPTPSPDGKFLAYVRRNSYATALCLYDLSSGASIELDGALDRDMQETWAIHGVYPSMAWTPDSKSLVYWKSGGIYKINTTDKQVTAIPFKVEQKHTLVDAVRFPVDVAPDEFDVKMLRWVQVNPQREQVLFQALGYIYIKDLPNGKAKRLTTQTDHFEFYPRFSRDGKSVVYTTWNDDELGSIRIVPVSGGKSRVVSVEKGHYLEPEFSPDGKRLVYTKSTGGYLRSGLFSHEPGIYVMDLAGGEPVRISKRGMQPHFGKADDRVFFVTVGDEMARELRSVSLTGDEERVHVTSAMGGEFEVSPKGDWLAFVEEYNVHLMPFVHTGKSYQIGPESKDLPVTTLSKNAGDYLHWNGAGDRLYWSLGNQLFHRDVKDAFTFMDGSPETLPEPLEEGLYIGFKQAHHRPESTFALTNARIITMNGDQVIENGTVLVEGNRIAAVGTADEVKVPGKAKVIDCAGKTVMPGILDVHAHGSHGTDEIIPQRSWHNYAGLTYGVTTIHDPSNDTSEIFAAAEMAKAGLILSPRVFSTGTILYGAKMPLYTAKINSLDDALTHLKRLKAVGAISVKSYNQPRRDQRQQVLAAAREVEINVVPEGGSLFMHNMTQVADGHTGIEHSIPVAQAYDDVVQFWSATDVFYTPTIGVGYGGIQGENYWYDTTDVWKNERLSRFVPSYILEPRSRRRVKAPLEEYNHIRIAELCNKLQKAGVPVNIGAHGQREGLAAHWEMWMLAQGGMSAHDVLRTATMNGARYLGMDRDLGSIEKGKLADLIVLNSNPLDDIYKSDDIAQVMLNGRLFDAETMNEIGNGDTVCKPFFWAKEGQSAPTSAAVLEATTGCGCAAHTHN